MTVILSTTLSSPVATTSAPRLPLRGSETESLLRQLIQNLSLDELEVAARVDYDYFRNPSPGNQIFYAKKFLCRYLEAHENNLSKALSMIKATISFREDMEVDKIRSSFDTDGCKETREALRAQLEQKAVFVEGHDKDGHGTYFFRPRYVQSHDNVEWTMKQHIYTLERAIASSRLRKVNAVVDFEGFAARHAPPVGLGRQFLRTFQNHYAGSINQVFLMDAPAAFMVLWSVLKPLVGKSVRDRIHFVRSSCPADAMRKAYPTGPSWLLHDEADSFDLAAYLSRPFDQAVC